MPIFVHQSRGRDVIARIGSLSVGRRMEGPIVCRIDTSILSPTRGRDRDLPVVGTPRSSRFFILAPCFKCRSMLLGLYRKLMPTIGIIAHPTAPLQFRTDKALDDVVRRKREMEEEAGRVSPVGLYGKNKSAAAR